MQTETANATARPSDRHTPGPVFRIVQSRQNARVKFLRAALRSGPQEGLVALEGLHLLEEALRSGLQLATVFVREGSEKLLDSLLRPHGGFHALSAATELLLLTPEVFASAASTEAPQGIAALAAVPTFGPEALLADSAPLVLVAAGLQDPGNLGTLARSAEAFGASGLLLLPGTVSPWNAKAIRASAGSVFRLPIASAADPGHLRKRGLRLLAAVPAEGTPAAQAGLDQGCALVLGNEGAGLSSELLAECDERITILCPGPVESLNAAIAGGILLYEAARQRQTRVRP